MSYLSFWMITWTSMRCRENGVGRRKEPKKCTSTFREWELEVSRPYYTWHHMQREYEAQWNLSHVVDTCPVHGAPFFSFRPFALSEVRRIHCHSCNLYGCHRLRFAFLLPLRAICLGCEWSFSVWALHSECRGPPVFHFPFRLIALHTRSSSEIDRNNLLPLLMIVARSRGLVCYLS